MWHYYQSGMAQEISGCITPHFSINSVNNMVVSQSRSTEHRMDQSHESGEQCCGYR